MAVKTIPADTREQALGRLSTDEMPAYRYAVSSHDGSMTLAETATEMVDDIIYGYASLTHEDALVRRYEVLVMLANAAQQQFVTAAAEYDRVVLADLDEDALTALFCERSEPFTGTEWHQKVPLILVETDYAPYTERPRPSGRIVWVSPETEVTFLRSLETLGVIHALAIF